MGGYGSSDGEFSHPRGIDVDAAGNVFVVDEVNYRIQKFDSSGAFLLAFGSQGSGDGQFDSAYDVAVSTDDETVYVCDRGNQRIVAFDSNGVFLENFGSGGSGPGQFNNIESIAVDSNGWIFASDSSHGYIQVFDDSWTYLGLSGSGLGTGDGESVYMTGVAVAPDGSVYSVDSGICRAQTFDRVVTAD